MSIGINVTGTVSDDSLQGTGDDDTLSGLAGNDTLSGLDGNDTLLGGVGRDSLDGGTGADLMDGGKGGDTYIVDDLGDVVVEAAGQGNDQVNSSITYTLGANVEDLTLTGTAAIDGTGNADINTIIGNAAANVLDGGAGADTLKGGAGDDTYFVDDTADVVTERGGEGIDTVFSGASFVLGAHVENLVLVGTEAIDGTGNAQANQITGNDADNVLDGANGNDTLVGGLGDDTYVVDSTGDVVVEDADAGTDTVVSNVAWTLAADFENLTLTGGKVINGIGNALDNVITGNGNGGALAGGLGDDTYVMSGTDVVLELADEGVDTVVSATDQVLAVNVENLTLIGIDLASGTGNELDNVLIGNDANNVLQGKAGDDFLDGRGGADFLIGGRGNDTYVVDSDTDVVSENANVGIDTVLSSISWSLSANVENLVLTGTDAIDGIGNSSDNTLQGNDGANFLFGGAGNDTYVVGGGDTVVEQADEGVDTVQSSVDWTLDANLENLTLVGDAVNGTGNELDNTITGNAADNVLDGGAGADTLDGGAGADALTGGDGGDTYVVDDAGDAVTEGLNQGTDTVRASVSWQLGANLENLTLEGTEAIDGKGNALANVITGNDAGNVLDGGAGADTLAGGLGNDTYVVDDLHDVILENADEGIDTVRSGMSYTLGAELENLELTGTGAINGTGNALDNVLTGNSGKNVLTGGAGADTLNGGAEADRMFGGLGDDTYVVDNALDVTVENAGEGVDTVIASLTSTLLFNVENLQLAGTAALNGTGNALDNQITGNSGANVLDGKAGNDTLAGGLGDDTYVVDSSGDVLVEDAGAGTDIVQSSVGWTLDANFENLTLTGSGAISGTGNAGNNVIRGNGAANVLTGGAGNDMYYVTSVDTIVENASEGTDTAVATTTYTLAANVENLILSGTAGNGTGNALNNHLSGNAGNNILDGKAGNDNMVGAGGNDTYIVDASGDGVVENANQGTDTVQSSVSYTLGANVENLTLTGTAAINGTGNALDNEMKGNSGANVLTGGAGNDTYTVAAGDSVVEQANEGTDTVLSSVSWTLGANTENLTLSGASSLSGTGNGLSNALTGNAGANTLDGLAGNDILRGLAGNDLLRDLTGNNALDGGAGTDTLQAGGGNAFLAGGTGNDQVQTGAGNAQVIAFNHGDGLDVMTGTGNHEDTLSLGEINFAELHFSRTGNDLTLNTGAGEGVLLKDWYLAGHQAVGTLQMIIDGTTDYDAGSADALHNSKVVQFDFAGLVSQFEQGGSPADWSLEPALAASLVHAGDTAALGGDLAMVYAHDGALGALGAQAMLSVVGSPDFGAHDQPFAV